VGKIKIDGTQVSFIVGGSWGKGVDYKIKIKGLKVGAIGVAKVSAVGTVYNMNDLNKFSGTYVAGQAGVAIAGELVDQCMKTKTRSIYGSNRPGRELHLILG